LLIGLVVLAIRLSGSPTIFRYYPPISIGFGFRSLGSDMLNGLVSDLWFANVYWGLLNLLPIYPLDGGQATAALFQWKDPHDGLRKALTLSFGTAVLLVAYAILNGGGFSFIAIFFGFLAYQNYQLLQALRGRSGGSPW
jgi:membrane-associated protease RseP (regulator of RpoE activity)